jgi:hypothetical protein
LGYEPNQHLLNAVESTALTRAKTLNRMVEHCQQRGVIYAKFCADSLFTETLPTVDPKIW